MIKVRLRPLWRDLVSGSESGIRAGQADAVGGSRKGNSYEISDANLGLDGRIGGLCRRRLGASDDGNSVWHRSRSDRRLDSGAQVTLSNQGTGAVLTTSSAENGEFAFSALLVGKYTLKIVAGGFKTYVNRNIDLAASQVVRQPYALEMAAQVIRTWDIYNPRELAYAMTRMHTILNEILPGNDPTVLTLRVRIGMNNLTVDGLALPEFVAIAFALFAYGNAETTEEMSRVILEPAGFFRDFARAQPPLTSNPRSTSPAAMCWSHIPTA